MKILKFGKEARDDLKKGCQIMYRAVGTTYSPAGRNVAYARRWGTPAVIHDGVSVAKEVEVEDEGVQMGIDLIREAAQNQVSTTGDGTTLTTILAYHIVDKGMKLVDENVNPMVLRKQILKVLPLLVEEVKKRSQEVKTSEQIEHVALVSSDDKEIASAVAFSIGKVGSTGLVTVEINKRSKIETNYTEGMQFERGWGRFAHFVTNPEKMEAVIENPAVLVLGRKVTLVDEILPLVQVVIAKGSKSLLIVGEVDGDAISTLIVNKMKGNLNILVVEPPGYGDPRRDALEDIALITGSTVVTDEVGLPKDQFATSFKKEWIGSTKKVIATKGTTNIIKYDSSDFTKPEHKKGIDDRNKLIAEKIAQLEQLRKTTDSVYDKEQIAVRLARLTTGIAVIKVGAASEIEQKEKMERVKDAVPAAQAAAEEGIVPGGGVVLTQIAQILKDLPEQNEGTNLLYDVLHEPMLKILENAGESDKRKKEIIEEIKKKGGNFGYNVLSEKVEDLIKSGVIDPTKVVRLALENSIGVATSILTTDCIIPVKNEVVNTNMQMA